MSVTDGPVCSTDNPNGDPCSTSYNWYVTTKGDTMRMINQRSNITSSSATGNPGEFCFGTDSGTTYLYYCVATNTWQRAALSTF